MGAVIFSLVNKLRYGCMQILLLDDRIPDPHFGAGFPRAYRILLSLHDLGHKIIFYPTLKHTLKEVNRERLMEYGVEVCDDLTTLKGRAIDVAILSRPHNVHYHLPVIQKVLPNTKTIYDTEALWFRRYDLQLAITGKLPGWAYRYDELGMARAVDLCFVVNNTEKQILEANGVKRVVRLGHALDIDSDGKPFNERKDFLVVGGILEEDSSNEDGLWWYLENCWAKVEAATGAKLKITGRAHSKRLLEQKLPGVEIMGHVDELKDCYQNDSVFVATTRFATGIPWKVHEAMANGIPCMISSLLADQLGVTDGVEALVSHSVQEAIDKSIQLYSKESDWTKSRENAFGLVQRDCDPEDFKKILQTAIASIVP